MRINRKFDFQDGEIAYSDQVDQELNQILDVINGQIASDNIAAGSIDKDRLSFFVSNYWQDPVATFSALASLSPNNGELRLVLDEWNIYAYSETQLKWVKFMTLTDHSALTGTGNPNLHPISSITGLQTQLDGINSSLNTNTTNISSLTTRITTAEGNIIKRSTTAPTPAVSGNLWFDTTNNILKYYNGSTWISVTKTKTSELTNDSGFITAANIPVTSVAGKTGAVTLVESDITNLDKYKKSEVDSLLTGKEKSIAKSSTAPSSPVVNDLWIDTSATPNVLKRYDGSAWGTVGAAGGGGGATIDDTITSTTEVWSSSKVSSELSLKEPSIGTKKTAFNQDFQTGTNAGTSTNVARADHKHTEADITNLDKYTKTETDNLLVSKIDKPAGAVIGDKLVYNGTNWAREQAQIVEMIELKANFSVGASYTTITWGSGQTLAPNFNSTNNTWVCPKSGLYEVKADALFYNCTAAKSYFVQMLQSGNATAYSMGIETAGGYYAHCDGSTLIQLTAGDTLTFQAYAEVTTNISGDPTHRSHVIIKSIKFS